MLEKGRTRQLVTPMMTLWVIVTVTFFLMKALPGDPFNQEQALPEETLLSLRKHYGLEDPLLKQYVRYLVNIIRWDLGPSFRYPDQTVNSIIRVGAPISMVLGLQALLVSLLFGIGLGTMAALKQNRWQDHLAMLIGILGVSLPSFIAATLLQYLIATRWGLLPIARWGTFAQSLLPTLSLALLPIAYLSRLTRANILEIYKQDYIKTARAKGVNEWGILKRHVLKNALLPLLPYFGQMAAGILTGSFIIEKIFAIPGLGQAFVTSVMNRDYTVIMGLTVFYSLILIGCVFVVDLMYSLLDPRVKKERSL